MAKRKGTEPGHAIRAYLEKNGISQKNFGEKLDVSQTLISQWIKGRARPTPAMAPLIEHVTGGQISRKDLFPELYGKVA